MAKNMTATAEKANPLSSLLSVSRSVSLSSGPLFSLNSQNPAFCQPVRIEDMTVRGSISNYGDAYGKKTGKGKNKGDKLSNVDAPNPQTVEAAYLPQDHDRVRLSFSMKVLPISLDRVSCNSLENTKRLEDFIAAYGKADGFRTLASLIAWAAAAALPLWRNRYGVDRTVIIRDTLAEGKPVVYSGSAEAINPKQPDTDESRNVLIDALADAFSGKKPITLLDVEMGSTVGAGQEVFPSQDFAPDSREKKSRLLFSIDDRKGGRQAALHPQKIWAALRQIDIWHDQFEHFGPLTVEPLGYSHQHQQAFRKPDSKKDLYSCLVQIDDLIEELNNGKVSENSHFLAANLMRGGVFSAGKEGGKDNAGTPSSDAAADDEELR